MKTRFFLPGISRGMLIIISIFIISIAFYSCNKDDKDDIEDNGKKDEVVVTDNYYVKYVIFCNYPRVFSDWSVTTPQGNFTKNHYQTRRWEQTYGPVKKGFKCMAQVGLGEPTIEIYISKNQEPFALKSSTTVSSYTRSSVYTIDF